MKVVVLGGGGLLARHVAAELGIRAMPVPHADCDLADEKAVKSAVTGASAVINCAAWTDVDGAERNESAAYRANALGAENAARAAAELGVPFVHVSTGFVFDGTAERPYDEFDAVRPLSVYARSKWAGEELVRAAHPRPFVVRLQSIYGGGGRNFASTLRRRILDRSPLKLDAVRPAQPTWAGAAARQIVALLESDRPGTYHATCSGSTTWSAFAGVIAARVGVVPYWDEVDPAAITGPAARPNNFLLARRMLELRGLDRMPDWRSALEEYLEREESAK